MFPFFLENFFFSVYPSFQKSISAKKLQKGDHSDTDDDDLEDALHEMTASAGKYVARSTLLPKGVINVKRLDNITRGHRLGKVLNFQIYFV